MEARLNRRREKRANGFGSGADGGGTEKEAAHPTEADPWPEMAVEAGLCEGHGRNGGGRRGGGVAGV